MASKWHTRVSEECGFVNEWKQSLLLLAEGNVISTAQTVWTESGVLSSDNMPKGVCVADIDECISGSDVSSFGFLYGGGGKQFGLQILGALSIAAWSLFLSYVLFSNLERYKLLRLAFADEAQGVGGFGISNNAGNALGKDIRGMYSKRTSMRSRSQLEDPIRVTTITPSVPSRAVELAQPGLD